jgi:hypothetical protein
LKFSSKSLEQASADVPEGWPLEKLYPACTKPATRSIFTPLDSVTKGRRARARRARPQALDDHGRLRADPRHLDGDVQHRAFQIHRWPSKPVGALLPTLAGHRSSVTSLPVSADSSSIGSCLVHGAIYFLPVIDRDATRSAAHRGQVFAIIRGHEVNEGLPRHRYALPAHRAAHDPPTGSWRSGIAFGVVIGKEIFGGTGMNFLNPALTARAFLFFAYPAQLSGEVWVAAQFKADGLSGATWLAQLRGRIRPPRRLHVGGTRFFGTHPRLDGRDLGARVPARRGATALHPHRGLADDARRHRGHGRDGARAQRRRLGDQRPWSTCPGTTTSWSAAGPSAWSSWPPIP